MQDGVVDNTERMKAIKFFLDSQDADAEAVAQKESLLEELTEIVENIDFARGALAEAGCFTTGACRDSQQIESS